MPVQRSHRPWLRSDLDYNMCTSYHPYSQSVRIIWQTVFFAMLLVLLDRFLDFFCQQRNLCIRIIIPWDLLQGLPFTFHSSDASLHCPLFLLMQIPLLILFWVNRLIIVYIDSRLPHLEGVPTINSDTAKTLYRSIASTFNKVWILIYALCIFHLTTPFFFGESLYFQIKPFAVHHFSLLCK